MGGGDDDGVISERDAKSLAIDIEHQTYQDHNCSITI